MAVNPDPEAHEERVQAHAKAAEVNDPDRKKRERKPKAEPDPKVEAVATQLEDLMDEMDRVEATLEGRPEVLAILQLIHARIHKAWLAANDLRP